jgi:hypothetical protein
MGQNQGFIVALSSTKTGLDACPTLDPCKIEKLSEKIVFTSDTA